MPQVAMAVDPCVTQRPRAYRVSLHVRCRASPDNSAASNQYLSRRSLLQLGVATLSLPAQAPARSAEPRVALITGANSGIGFATAQRLLGQGWCTVLACRNLASAEQAADRLAALALPGTVRVLDGSPLDLGDLRCVNTYVREFRASGLPLDVLVNNAGVMATPEGRTADGLESQFGVNHMGHFALTTGLLPELRQSKGRIVHVSSLAALAGQLDLTDLLWERRKYERWSAYGASKLCNVLFSQELGMREAENGVVSNVCHPGLVATNLARYILPENMAAGARDDPAAYERSAKFFGLRTPTQGAETSVWLASSADSMAARSSRPGEMYVDPGSTFRVPLASGAKGERLARDLWSVSEDILTNKQEA